MRSKYDDPTTVASRIRLRPRRACNDMPDIPELSSQSSDLRLEAWIEALVRFRGSKTTVAKAISLFRR